LRSDLDSGHQWSGTASLRSFAERVVDLADHLPASDRALLRGIYDRGMSAAEFARAIGQRPRTVRRRVHRLLSRVTSPAFQFVLRSAGRWPERRRRVGTLVFLHGCSIRGTARQLGVSQHRIRQETDGIRVLLQQELEGSKDGPRRG